MVSIGATGTLAAVSWATLQLAIKGTADLKSKNVTIKTGMFYVDPRNQAVKECKQVPDDSSYSYPAGISPSLLQFALFDSDKEILIGSCMVEFLHLLSSKLLPCEETKWFSLTLNGAYTGKICVSMTAIPVLEKPSSPSSSDSSNSPPGTPKGPRAATQSSARATATRASPPVHATLQWQPSAPGSISPTSYQTKSSRSTVMVEDLDDVESEFLNSLNKRPSSRQASTMDPFPFAFAPTSTSASGSPTNSRPTSRALSSRPMSRGFIGGSLVTSSLRGSPLAEVPESPALVPRVV
mmetsp:Transcript_31926/g.51556  ORF Transcript_31926/g.51556 Transcript_31926/m.51556 type:complete len:295 (+) Transcript_31926:157-1041(+)